MVGSAGETSTGEALESGFRQTQMGLVPQDWELRRLDDLVDKRRGIRYGIIQPGKYDPNGRLMIRGQDYSKGWVDSSQMFRVSAGIEERYRNARVKVGDILITIVGASTGHVAIVPEWLEGANLTQTTARIAIDARKADNRLCFYMLQGRIGEVLTANYIKGGAQPGLNCGDIERFVLPLPQNRVEQSEIADVLSDIDASIQALGRLVMKKRAMKQGTMQVLLTGRARLPGFDQAWKPIRMGDIGDTYGGLSGKSKEDFGSGGAPYITFLSVLNSARIETADFGRVNVSPRESQNRVRMGDLLFNGTSETPGDLAMGALVAVDLPNLYLNSFCFGLRLKRRDLHDGLFLAYTFRSGKGRQLLKKLAQGAIRYNLSKSQFKDLELPLPAYDEQRAISGVLSDMDTEINALDRRRDKLQRIKEGVMQSLLSGRVRLTR